jgi:hypothetical protein
VRTGGRRKLRANEQHILQRESLSKGTNTRKVGCSQGQWQKRSALRKMVTWLLEDNNNWGTVGQVRRERARERAPQGKQEPSKDGTADASG